MYSNSTQKKVPISNRYLTDALKVLKDAGFDVSALSKEKTDWDKNDIVYAIKKTGTNMSALSLAKGFSRNTLRNALYRSYPNAEKVIAEQIGVEPSEIWPSRYDL